MIKEALRIFKYGVVGISGTIIDLVAIFILVEFVDMPVLISATISFLLAATNNFIWNKKWTFRNRNLNYPHQYIKFLIVSTVGLIITLILMYVLNFLLGIWYILAKIITSIFVLTWNYIGNRNWTFKPSVRTNFANQEFKYDLSIVIPAFNEADRITETLKSVASFLNKQKYTSEVIIVNDGSEDDTKKVVDNFISKQNHWSLINLPENSGKGFAVKTGIMNSSGKYVLFSDADGAAPISELKKLMEHINDYDIVIGSRKIKSPEFIGQQPFYRQIISKFGSMLSLTLVKNIKDTQCGFKLMRSPVAKYIFSKQKISRYGFDLEMLAIAQHYDYTLAEIPISWQHVDSSKFRPIIDSIKTLKEFAIIQYNFLKKKY